MARLLSARQCRAPPVAPRPPPPARGTARRARIQAQVIKALLRQPTAASTCARKSWGRVQPATGRDPAIRQQSPQLLRPQPIPLQSPPPSLNPPLCRYRRQDRQQDPDPQPSRDPQRELAPPPRLDRRQECSARPHSRQSRGMPSPCPTTRTRRGLASYSKVHLAPGPLAWGLERQRASGRRRLPTSAGGLGCRAPSAPPLFGSWRKVNWVPGPPEQVGLGQQQGGGGPVGSGRPVPSGTQSHPSAHPCEVMVCGASPVPFSPPPSPLLSFPISVGG